MELTRLDAMQAAVYAEAINGDTGAIDTCLKIMNQRQRLLNLVPDHKPPAFNLSFGGGTDMPNAEEVGIRVEFVRPSPGLRNADFMGISAVFPRDLLGF